MQNSIARKPVAEEISFRSATVEDIGMMLELIAEHAAYQDLSHEVVATEQDIRNTFFCENPRVVAMIAEWQNNPAGLGTYFFTNSTFQGKYGIYIEDVYVRPEYRGQGIGTAFFQHICQKAIDENYGRVQWCVLTDNKPAVEFYNNLGARPLEEWMTYRLEGDAIANVANKKAA